MVGVQENTAVQVSAEVARAHLHNYYRALESQRDTIASFYIPPTPVDKGKDLPTIIFNGNFLPDAAAMQLLMDKMPTTQYEVQAFDCQVVNPAVAVEGRTDSDIEKGKNMTLIVTVSGTLKLGPADETEVRGYTELFILVPNPEAVNAKKRAKNVKEWLIQTQTFRVIS